MHGILLSSTLHDPQGRLLEDLPSALKVVLNHYDGWVVSYTPITNRRIKELLIHHRNIYTKPLHIKDLHAKEQIEFNHLRALEIAREIAAERDIARIQYTDADRIIMAANRFPASFTVLDTILRKYTAHRKFYMNLRRTTGDFLSHHLPLVQTEKIVNELYSEVFGMPIDIGSTAHVMSPDVVDRILQDSHLLPPVSFPHPKWLIVAVMMRAYIHSEEIEGMLTFETPEQYKKDVAKALDRADLHKYTEKEIKVVQRSETVKIKDSTVSALASEELEDDYFLLQQAYESTIGRFANVSQREWRLRYHTQYQYLNVLRHSLPVLGLGLHEKAYARKIEKAIEQAKRQKEQILHILRRKAQQVEISVKETLQEA